MTEGDEPAPWKSDAARQTVEKRHACLHAVAPTDKEHNQRVEQLLAWEEQIANKESEMEVGD